MADAAEIAKKMTVEEFIEWYDRQPPGSRYELIDGVPVGYSANPDGSIPIDPNVPLEMQAEREIHARLKFKAALQFQNGVEKAKLRCTVYGDGRSVRVASDKTYEPDAMVRCGPPLPPDQVVVDDPMIVVEVTSPSTWREDAYRKTIRYFENPALMHCLIVSVEDRVVSWHRRDSNSMGGDGPILLSHHEDGVLDLDPPGLAFDVGALFAEAE